MGIILAKREEDRLQYNQTRTRAQIYLQKCKPEYIEDEALLGLAPEDEDPDAIQETDEEEEEAEEGEDKAEDEDEEKDEEEEIAEETAVDPAKRARERVKAELKKLRHAAIKGDKWRLAKMTRSPHLAIDTPDKYGRTALYLAVERGQARAVEILLAARARHEAKTKEGWTPLHAAAFHGQVQCITLLLQAQADINAKEKHGCTPLMMAASSPKLYLVDLVSKADRRIRSRVRRDAMKRLREEESGMDADMLNRIKEKMDGGTSQTAPNLVWKFYPNRIEILVLNALLDANKIKVDAADNRRRTAILYAARYGRVYAVSRLLDAKASLAFADREGQVALFAAACNEHYDTVDLLLRAGASINATDQYFRTPLHGALEIGDESMANLLLKAEASVNAYDCEGRTPIMLAMDNANRRLFKKIVEKKSNLDVLDKRGWNVVIYAIETGMLGDVYPLLVKLNKNAAIILRARDPQGCNSMHHAAQLEIPTVSARCVDQLMNLDMEAATIGDCNGDTAIHSAAERGRLEVLRLFLDKIPVADFLNNRGETPLHYAARGGHMACVVALLHDGAGKQSSCDSSAIDSAGWNLLMHACVSGHLDLVNLLLQNREGQHPDLAFSPLDVNHADASGVNALCVAAREGHWQLLPSLVIAGLNTSAKDRDGFTAAHWAAMEDEPLTMKCLLDLHCDANVSDAKGWTPLMHACARGADEVVRVLVDDRADINARNWDGDTALQITMRRRDPPDIVAVTKDIIIDGIMAQDEPKTGGSIAALGHMMVSVLEATDLYLEGKTGVVNTYVNLQLRMQNGARPQAAFTSCVLQKSSPSWHEVFRFDTTRMDPSACLVAWVVAAPGQSAKDVMDGAAMGLDEEELAALSHMEALTGKTLNNTTPQFTSAMQDSFKRLMKRSDREEDAEVLRLRKLAMAQLTGSEPTQDLKFSQAQVKGNDGLSVADRRWNEVRNLREVLAASGCDVPEPLVPRTHLPLGCVVIRYRHLRAAVWGNEPVTVVRTLRLSCRGSLRVQIDFRPKFFECAEQERAKLLSQEEEDELQRARDAVDDVVAHTCEDAARRQNRVNDD